MEPMNIDWVFPADKAPPAEVRTAKEGPVEFFKDYDEASFRATIRMCPLVIWAGCKVNDHQQFAKDLGDVVHVELDRRGAPIPHVCILGGDGYERIVREKNLTARAADQIKEAWNQIGPKVPNTYSGVGIVETIGEDD